MTISESGDDSASKLAFLVLNAILALMVLFGLLLVIGATNLALGGGPPWAAALVLVCALFVGGAGLALLYRAHFRARVIAAREAAMLKRYPGQPWMLNPDWASGEINDPQIGRVIFLIIFMAGWLGGLVFIGVVNFDKILPELQTSPAAWAAAAFFALITVTAINMTVKVARSWARLGNGLLRLETLPGRIGGQFKAKLEMRLRQRPSEDLQADLTCIRHIPAKDRQDVQRDEEQLWWQSTRISPTQMRKTSQSLVIPIVFDIDDGLPESGPDGQGGLVVWHLRVSSSGKTDQFLLFEWTVPVYRSSLKRSNRS